jgi:hypothetical protein
MHIYSVSFVESSYIRYTYIHICIYTYIQIYIHTVYIQTYIHIIPGSTADPAKRLLSYLESHPNPSQQSESGQLKLDMLLHKKERELTSIQKWLQL